MGMRIAALCAFAAACGAPAAAAVLPPVYVGVTGGTLGIGPEVGYSFNPFVGVRASATFLDIHGHGTTGGYRYEGEVHLDNWGGALDLYPLANAFGGLRLSAGARVTEHNRVGFTGQATDTRNYGGMTFTPDQAGSISGKVHTLSVSPMVTVGYARRVAGFSFGIDAGAMMHGTPRADDFIATGQLATNVAARSEYLNQQDRVRNAIAPYKYYPVLQISLGYRF